LVSESVVFICVMSMVMFVTVGGERTARNI